MVFSSLEFIYLFLPPVLIGFAILRALKLETAVIWWLIMASLGFYAWWSVPYLCLLLGSVLFNYGLHLLIQKYHRKALFVLGVAVNLSLLGLFKYADFLIENFNVVTGADAGSLGLILPLAISFYTFQQISFLRDSLRGELVDFDFKKYLLFVTFFPQLIAGPIVMQKDTIPQFRLSVLQNRAALNFVLGTTLFLIGLFKKIVFADGLAPYANAAFSVVDAGQTLSADFAWMGALAYTFQIYFDFSGYCDMALGLALMFGIRLPINFNSPYRSLSIVEFWRRWHITLSRFLRDYIYIPLGGNRSGRFGARGNLMITMLLGGLWHGAGWNFIIWGGLHGGYLITNHFWSGSAARAFLVNSLPKTAYTLLAWALTMSCVVIAWVFFRAETFDGGISMLGSMLLINESATSAMPALILQNTTWLITAIICLFCVVTLFPNSLEITRNYRPVLMAHKEVARIGKGRLALRWRPNLIWGACFLMIGTGGIIQIYRLNGLTEFIYFNF